jgi:hypothetical protein
VFGGAAHLPTQASTATKIAAGLIRLPGVFAVVTTKTPA